MPKDATLAKTATLYRMDMGSHVCPHGLKARALLREQGYVVDEHLLETREAIDAFKAQHDVKTTPQIWIDGAHIGGSSDLATHLGHTEAEGDSYRPVIAIFATGGALAMTVSWLVYQNPLTWMTLSWFISINMVLLGLQKLKDLDGFATMFLSYDLLAKRWRRYGYVYPFIETGAGLLMTAMVLPWLSVPLALFAAGIGAVSVFQAVYVEKRDLKCACVGGGSNVPLGFVSLTENLAMLGMALWMGWAALV